MKRLLPFVGAAAALAGGHAAHAQSVPYPPIQLGQVWTPAQWNAAWSSKQDLSAIPGGGGYVSVRSFGAVGDGVADDTNAIKNGEASLSPGQVLWFPPGTYRFTSALGPFTRQGFSWQGEGYNQSILLYDGAATNIDLLTLGNGAAIVNGVFIDDLALRSKTKMTAGAAINAKATTRATYNIKLQGITGTTLYGNQLWNGLLIAQGDNIIYSGNDVAAQNDGIQVWGGTLGSASFYTTPGLFISGCVIGIHIAGGFYDTAISQGRITNCTTGFKLDQSVAASANNDVMLNGVYFDTCTGNGIELADPSGAPIVSIDGCVLNWSGANGIHIATNHGGFTNITGCLIANSTLDGIRIEQTSGTTSVFSNSIIYNHGWGVNPTVAGMLYALTANEYYNNTSGSVNGAFPSTGAFGDLGFSTAARIMYDGTFYMGFLGSVPTISLDANDAIQYDRTNNALNFIIGGTQVAALNASSLWLGITGFGLNWTTPNDPSLSWDSNDYEYYDRSVNTFGWAIGGLSYMQLNNTWLSFPQISAFGINLASSTGPYLQWDNNDYYQYDRTNNLHLFAINGGVQLQIGGGFIRQGAVAVASLPSASAVQSGARAMVNNATATTFYSIVAGGGTNVVPVFSDGTNWRIG